MPGRRWPARARASRGFSLLPTPPDLSRNESPDDGDAVYVLREGVLAPLAVEAGLSDGRWTEVSAPDLSEGAAVVVEILEERS